MSDWKESVPDDVLPDDVSLDDVEGIPVEDVPVLTFEETVPVEDVSIPRRNFLEGKARHVEDSLASILDPVEGAILTAKGPQSHRDVVTAERIGPDATIDVHDLEEDGRLLVAGILSHLSDSYLESDADSRLT